MVFSWLVGSIFPQDQAICPFSSARRNLGERVARSMHFGATVFSRETTPYAWNHGDWRWRYRKIL